ncbi:MAG: SDR family NAD(P)-dependent oxidoreductase, partial [Polyangiaceae bacterium]
FLPPMVARKRGHVVNVSSAAGYFAAGLLGAYCTTKFGVFGLSEALREELGPHGIGVSTICPGLIDTPIIGATRRRGKMAAPERQARVAELYKKRGFGPEKVGSAILDAVARKRTVVPVTPEAWFLYAAKRVAPGLLARISSMISAKTTG